MVPADLEYPALEDWHRDAVRRYLEPARLGAVRQLTDLLDSGIPTEDRPRFRISSSRIKEPPRLLTKLLRQKYSEKFTTYEAIPDIIDDLVGLRLICNNLSDVNTFQELVGELPEMGDTHIPLAVESASHRDYFAEPKPSGYRAYHVNLVVPVHQALSTRAVRVEVQVRTLLQDGWGELTHEDTYKPGSKVPEWIITMSSRMAELLAAVDNIAQDLRVGLDAEATRILSSQPSTPESLEPIQSSTESAGSPQQAMYQALKTAAREEVSRMSSVRPLAAVSQELVRQFGNDIAPTWAGYGSFKTFIENVCPEATITPPNPGYLHPPGVPVPTDWYNDDSLVEQQVPSFIRELRTYLKAVPLISRPRWRSLINTVPVVLDRQTSPIVGDQIRTSQIDSLAREVRDFAAQQNELVVLPHAAFVLRTLLAHHRLKPGITSEEVREVLYASLLQSAHQNRLIDDPYEAKKLLEAWMGS